MVNTVRSLAQKNFKPRVKKWQDGSFPFENIKDVAEIGVLGMAVPEEFLDHALNLSPWNLSYKNMSDVRYIVAGNTDALSVELARLPTGETAYITAADFARITGERLDEFSTVGRRMLGDLAAQSWCAIRVQDGRVFFTKK